MVTRLAETGPLDASKLSPEQIQLMLNVAKALEGMATDGVQSPSRDQAAPPSLPSEERAPRVILIHGRRGAGKTSLMLTAARLAHPPAGGGHGSRPGSRGLKEAQQALQHTWWVESRDLHPLPARIPVYAWLLTAFQPLVAWLDDRGQDSSLSTQLVELQERSIEGWDQAHAPHEGGQKEWLLDGRDAVEAWSKLPHSWRNFVDEMASAFDRHSPSRHRLFVVPVDDIDMHLERVDELVQALRHLYHPRVAFVLTANLRQLEFGLDQAYGRAFKLGYATVSDALELHGEARSEVLGRVRRLGRALLGKVVPQPLRFQQKPLTWDQALEHSSAGSDSLLAWLQAQREDRAATIVGQFVSLQSVKRAGPTWRELTRAREALASAFPQQDQVTPDWREVLRTFIEAWDLPAPRERVVLSVVPQERLALGAETGEIWLGRMRAIRPDQAPPSDALRHREDDPAVLLRLLMACISPEDWYLAAVDVEGSIVFTRHVVHPVLGTIDLPWPRPAGQNLYDQVLMPEQQLAARKTIKGLADQLQILLVALGSNENVPVDARGNVDPNQVQLAVAGGVTILAAPEFGLPAPLQALLTWTIRGRSFQEVRQRRLEQLQLALGDRITASPQLLERLDEMYPVAPLTQLTQSQVGAWWWLRSPLYRENWEPLLSLRYDAIGASGTFPCSLGPLLGDTEVETPINAAIGGWMLWFLGWSEENWRPALELMLHLVAQLQVEGVTDPGWFVEQVATRLNWEPKTVRELLATGSPDRVAAFGDSWSWGVVGDARVRRVVNAHLLAGGTERGRIAWHAIAQALGADRSMTWRPARQGDAPLLNTSQAVLHRAPFKAWFDHWLVDHVLGEVIARYGHSDSGVTLLVLNALYTSALLLSDPRERWSCLSPPADGLPIDATIPFAQAARLTQRALEKLRGDDRPTPVHNWAEHALKVAPSLLRSSEDRETWLQMRQFSERPQKTSNTGSPRKLLERLNTLEDGELIASLMQLIGRRAIQGLLDWRREKGDFQRLEDVLQVKGIGEVTYRKLLKQAELLESVAEPSRL